MSISSKPLGKGDESGYEFAVEMLAGDPTAAINFDRLQKNVITGQYIIFEYLLCEEWQESRKITPYTSHPNKYMHKNRMKFIKLWDAACKLEAELYLVNYAKKGTHHENEVLLMKVLNVTNDRVETEDVRYTRESFSKWFREMNKMCLNQE